MLLVTPSRLHCRYWRACSADRTPLAGDFMLVQVRGSREPYFAPTDCCAARGAAQMNSYGADVCKAFM